MVLYVFDVDDTLINTKACVRAVDNQTGEVIFRVGTKVFNAPDNTEMLIGRDLRWDFSEFEDLQGLLVETTKPAFNDLRDINEDQSSWDPGQTYIITARSQANHIHTWLDVKGVEIPKDRIRCYDRSSQLPVWAFKKQQLDRLIEELHPDEVYIWEDDRANLVNMELACTEADVPCIIMPV